MKLLLHCCCGPCAVGALPLLRAAGYDISCLFYNPNIHPYMEHQARRDSFLRLMQRENLPYQAAEDYPLEAWLAQIAPDPANRCAYCYRDRLETAARLAKEQGYPAFGSTLLISPYQDQEQLFAIGGELAEQYGLRFAALDLRPRFRAGQQEARGLGLYMQKYCGCIYSEKERYHKTAGRRQEQ